jgi:hypothetical protein
MEHRLALAKIEHVGKNIPYSNDPERIKSQHLSTLSGRGTLSTPRGPLD